MQIESLGDAWQPSDCRAPSTRCSRRTLSGTSSRRRRSRLARRHRVLLDGQGLVRVPQTGPLQLDDDFDPEILRHVDPEARRGGSRGVGDPTTPVCARSCSRRAHADRPSTTTAAPSSFRHTDWTSIQPAPATRFRRRTSLLATPGSLLSVPHAAPPPSSHRSWRSERARRNSRGVVHDRPRDG